MNSRNKDKITLQSTVSAALKKLSTVGQRKEILGEDDTNIRSIIYHRANQNMLFGIFASYEKGTHQLTIADDDDAEMLLVEQVAPPEAEDKKRREFLEGVCYFAFFGNHVVVIQSSALGTKHLERHLNWLLRTAGLIDTENSVGLTDFILEATKEKIRASHVKDLVIGTPLVDIDHVTAMKETTSQKTTLLDFGGKGITLLRDFLGEDKLKGLKLADAIDGNIEISLRIRYKQKTTEKGHPPMSG
ncbi:hypothetical protein [Undibacterium sp. SXout20W]|uniref:hypothetical protein n=1 Tax=Undibacterium sp. SXout20W TaxID=3413051 RepID=UPI003BF13D45